MGFMSPKELNDDPKKWLDVPHELHDSLLKFQEKLFPGFTQKLKEAQVHCFQCEGKETFPVIMKDTFKHQTCDGYIGDIGNFDELLLHCVDEK